MDGSSMWVSDYYGDGVSRRSIPNGRACRAMWPIPRAGSGPRGWPSVDGQWFATRYHSSYRTKIYRLNPTSGVIEQTFTTTDTFYYT